MVFVVGWWWQPVKFTPVDNKVTRDSRAKGEFYAIGVAKLVTEVFNAPSKVIHDKILNKRARQNKIFVAREAAGEGVTHRTTGGQQ